MNSPFHKLNDLPRFDVTSTDITEGQELFATTATLDRARLVAYAAASGDHNPIHYNDAAAQAAGLPGVLAHGMLTMGLAAAAVEEWAGAPGRVREISTRFSRPVVVPATVSTELRITGVAGLVADGVVRVDIKVEHEGRGVLTRARASVVAGS